MLCEVCQLSHVGNIILEKPAKLSVQIQALSTYMGFVLRKMMSSLGKLTVFQEQANEKPFAAITATSNTSFSHLIIFNFDHNFT